MEEIIEKVDRNLIEQELTADKYVRRANNGNSLIYILTAGNSPNILREIGRLREVTFRHAGGGTGKSIDLDEFDIGPHAYQQLIVWNPQDKEIVGSYRFIKCKDAEFINGEAKLATTELFKFSDEFLKNYFPYTIELGRSFIQPQYQPSEEFRKGLFSLDNLWDGLGAIVVDNADVKYYFGKVTMYTHFNVEARDYILAFMHYYFPDKEKLVTPKHPVTVSKDVSAFLKELNGLDYKAGHVVLNRHVRALGENIPPLFNSYMNISPSMKTFGTSINPHFGGVEETGIMIYIPDIYPTKKDRHLNSYYKEKEERLANKA